MMFDKDTLSNIKIIQTKNYTLSNIKLIKTALRHGYFIKTKITKTSSATWILY